MNKDQTIDRMSVYDLSGLSEDLRERIRQYHDHIFETSTRDYKILADFQRAMQNREITFYLQPQCRVSSRRIVGAESLARWQKPDGTWVSPATFIPILEKYNMVAELDQYLWEQICIWIRGFLDQGHEPVPISINVSRSDIFSIDVPACLSGLMQKYDLPFKYLKVEITESAYVEDMERIKDTVQALRDMGFLVLIDDFGSGYSSLNMLTNFNVDIIKLDAQFLHFDTIEEQKGISILESIVNMAKMLGTPVIVEGVETKEQVHFLSDLGCRYMQGYYYYRPMPRQDFEALISNEVNTDHKGFVFKANRQLHTREFLDSNIYSDAMLNNILGPVCFYNWQDENVDIIRFNQQFYLMIGLDADELESRRYHTQDFFYPDDLPSFYDMLQEAVDDRINGASGTFRVYKPNGSIFWIGVHVYYMDEDSNGKKFYASAQDLTELQYVNTELPGGYYRCSLDAGYEFLYISENFLKMTGYTAEEIKSLYNNRLMEMIHPNDIQDIIEQCNAVKTASSQNLRPYRLRHKDGHYIYVVENNRLTDSFGETCWQCVAIEVTEMMRLRNQMRLLTEFFEDSIVFIHEKENKTIEYEVVVHGLEKTFGFNKETFERMLNDGSFLAAFDMPADEKRRERYWENIDDLSRLNSISRVCLPGQEPFNMLCRFKRIHDDLGDVGGVITFTIARETRL